MKQTLLLFLLLLFGLHGSAKAFSASPDSSGRLSVNAELAGTGGFYDLALEWKLKPRGLYLWHGVSFFGAGAYRVLVVPVVVKKVFGNKINKLELGVGQAGSLGFNDHISAFPRGILLVGLRHQKPDSRWIFRASYTPLISYLLDFQYQNWGGFSVGYMIRSSSKQHP